MVAAGDAVTVSSALAARGFAYLRLPGRGVLFGLVLGSGGAAPATGRTG
jgi:hypothetical protein